MEMFDLMVLLYLYPLTSHSISCDVIWLCPLKSCGWVPEISVYLWNFRSLLKERKSEIWLCLRNPRRAQNSSSNQCKIAKWFSTLYQSIKSNNTNYIEHLHMSYETKKPVQNLPKSPIFQQTLLNQIYIVFNFIKSHPTTQGDKLAIFN